MKNRTRYNVQETYRNLFYQLPKLLFEKEFKGLSNDAKILYSLLKDRHELSILTTGMMKMAIYLSTLRGKNARIQL